MGDRRSPDPAAEALELLLDSCAVLTVPPSPCSHRRLPRVLLTLQATDTGRPGGVLPWATCCTPTTEPSGASSLGFKLIVPSADFHAQTAWPARPTDFHTQTAWPARREHRGGEGRADSGVGGAEVSLGRWPQEAVDYETGALVQSGFRAEVSTSSSLPAIQSL